MAKIDDVLHKNWEQLKARHPDILNIGVSTKFKQGKDTGRPSITIYVKKKLPQAQLVESERIPELIEVVETDVIEFDAPWLGHTSISRLSPAEQKKRFGANKNFNIPKSQRTILIPKAPSGQSDLTPFASPVRDQSSCGICLADTCCEVEEGMIHKATPGDTTLLSELDLFRCSGGTCAGGSNMDMLTPKLLLGVCLEICLPYKPMDGACGADRCAKWWIGARKLKAINPISDPNTILVALDTGPLAATMPVPQSFLNYTGPGIYKRLAIDPIVGYHGVSDWGYGNPDYFIGENHWGTGWGQFVVINGVAHPGFFLTDRSVFDRTQYQFELDSSPVPPQPPPTPECQTNADCLRLHGPGFQCVNGVCVPEEPPPIPGPTAVFTPSSGKVGIVVSVAGTLWLPPEVITDVLVGGMKAVDTLKVSANEQLSGTITIPGGLAAGTVDIVITGSGSGRVPFPGAFTVLKKKCWLCAALHKGFGR